MTRREVLWQRLDRPGLEHLRLETDARAVRAEGLVLGLADEPYSLSYRVHCDADWSAREVEVGVIGTSRFVALRGDGKGSWLQTSGDRTRHPLDGCVDVDIAATPFTNTLPLRRLALRPGESAELRVAYVAVPDLELSVARQRYTRLAERRFRYESVASGFVAELTVDEEGLVLDYPGVWRRMWPA